MKLTLKAARINANLTQAEAAQKIGCHRTSISNYESGKTIPDMQIGIRMSEVYGIQVDDISFLQQKST